ncbi:MAG: ATP-binding cassette domain-containing protein, partial [Acidimicrobiales bacterium]|nr:ATP-binding cassette domain-containing protein [Acidimicrobiales bacterium]
GLYLAVTTFAFALATTSYLLDDDRFGWVPSDRIGRAPLLGGFDVESELAVYYLALAVLVIVIAGLRGVRVSRFGRALVALRDNEAAAESYGIDPVRLRLAAFALSGAIAALAGGLFVHHERAFDPTSYSPLENLVVLTMVVVGGMTSLAGAVLGALFLLGTRWFLTSEWQILASGVGVLLVLLVAPGGLAGLVYRVRDRWLRLVAARSGLAIAGYGARSAPDGTLASESEAVFATRESAALPPATAPSSSAPASATATVPAANGSGASSGHDALLLSVSDVEVGYGGVPVLTGVDLAVREGEAVALLGTNGAGKSTLLRAISATVPPSGGTVRFDGVDLAGLAPHQVAARGIAQMPGGAGVFPSLTVAENLRVAGWLHRRDATGQVDDLRRVHELFPVLSDRADELAGNLSGGQQQMLALAMAVLMRPRLLMIDELSLGLAPAVVAELLRFVDHLREEGTTLVIVEQSVNVALEIADRAVFLERGQVRFSGPAADLLDRPDLLRSVFLGNAAVGQGSAADAASVLPPATGSHPGPPSASAAAAQSPAGTATTAGPVLRAVDLGVSFGGVRAVDGVSIAVGAG